MSSPEEQLKEIDKQIMITQVVDAPGAILFGLGLYAKFGANGDPFIPILKEENIVISMLGLGLAIMLWGGYKTITLAKEKTAIRKKYDL